MESLTDQEFYGQTRSNEYEENTLKEENTNNEENNNNIMEGDDNIPEKESEEEDYSLFENLIQSGEIKKYIVKEGKGDKCGEAKRLVTIKYKYHLMNNNYIIDQTEFEPYSFTIGNREVKKYLEIIVQSMKENEVAKFIIEPSYAEIDEDCIDNIPQNSSLVYTIHLLSIKEPLQPINSMKYDDRLIKAREIKAEGVEIFKNKNYKYAIVKFKNSMKYLKALNLDKQEYKEGEEVLLSLYSNIANCYIKLHKFMEAINIVNEAQITTKRTNAKCYYFRGIAYANLFEIENARKDYFSLKKMLEDIKFGDDKGLWYLYNLIEQKTRQKKYLRKLSYRKFFKDKDKNYYSKFPIVPQMREIPNKINPSHIQVFFEMSYIVNKKQKNAKIIFELFNDILPKTSNNFINLCRGIKKTILIKDEKTNKENEESPLIEGMTNTRSCNTIRSKTLSEKEHKEKKSKNTIFLCYKDTIIHRTLRGFIIEGGLINNKNQSSYETDYFDDENHYYSHSCPGVLAMFNSQKNTNGSHFYITLKEAPYLDGYHVVFGRVVQGLDVVKEICDIETDDEDVPITECKIVNCGTNLKLVRDLPPNDEID